jgi:hypothetical protein
MKAIELKYKAGQKSLKKQYQREGIKQIPEIIFNKRLKSTLIFFVHIFSPKTDFDAQLSNDFASGNIIGLKMTQTI